jgi:hypothetical protein
MSLTGPIKHRDMTSVRQAIQLLANKLGPNAVPTFSSIILTGLTSNRLIATDAAKQLISSDLISWVTGTANQITVTDDSDGTVTLSTPQDIDTGADVTFNSADLVNLFLHPTVVTGAGSITDGTAFECDTTSGDFTLNLPALGGNGRLLMICCSGGNTVTLDPSASETINGDTTFDLIEDESLILIDFSTEWRIF